MQYVSHDNIEFIFCTRAFRSAPPDCPLPELLVDLRCREVQEDYYFSVHCIRVVYNYIRDMFICTFFSFFLVMFCIHIQPFVFLATMLVSCRMAILAVKLTGSIRRSLRQLKSWLSHSQRTLVVLRIMITVYAQD